MGKISKRTKKFSKNQLGDAIKRRKAYQVKRDLYGRKNKSGKQREHDDSGDEEETKKKHQATAAPEQPAVNAKEYSEEAFMKELSGEADSESGEEEVEMDEDMELDEEEQHKKEMEELKRTQPEFYKFLEEEGDEALDFDVQKAQKDSKGAILTLDLLHMWKRDAEKNKSFGAIRRLVQSFSLASAVGKLEGDGESPKHRGIKYQILDGQIFNEVVVYCLKTMHLLFDRYLGYDQNAAEGKNFNPVKLPNWSKLQPLVKLYLSSILHFVHSLTDGSMLTHVLKSAEPIIRYFCPYPKLARLLLKKMLLVWESSSETNRIHAFFNIRRLAIDIPYPFIDMCLKGIYITFVRNAKFVTKTSATTVGFMLNCVVELYGIDFNSSYQHAYVYIRELVSHVKSAMNVKKNKDANSSIYNWQFLNSLQVWSRIIAAYPKQELITLLIHPVIQVIQATISVQPAAKYFPCRLHLIRMLNHVSARTTAFINTGAYLLELFQGMELGKKPKKSTEKAFDIRVALKVSKRTLGTKAFQDTLFEEAFYRTVEYCSIYARSLAFPELMYPMQYCLKKYSKETVHAHQRNKIKILLEKIDATSKMIQAKRNVMDYDPKNSQNTTTDLLFGGDLPITRYFNQLVAQAAKNKAAEPQGEDEDIELGSDDIPDDSNEESGEEGESEDGEDDGEEMEDDESESEDDDMDVDLGGNKKELSTFKSAKDFLGGSEESEESQYSIEEEEDMETDSKKKYKARGKRGGKKSKKSHSTPEKSSKPPKSPSSHSKSSPKGKNPMMKPRKPGQKKLH